MFFRLFTVATLLVTLVSCGSKPQTNDQGPLMPHNLKVFTYGDSYQEIDKKLRLLHGRQLSSEIANKRWFSSSEYVGDGRDIAGYDTLLRITFVFVHQGKTEWPLEIKAHYLLEHDGKTLFNQVYQVSATQYNANAICKGCSAEQTALKMLTDKTLPEINLALIKR